MRIVCLPIDSRPCNTQFVETLTQWGGGECILPGREALDDFDRPADHAASRAFLDRELPRADAAVISLDQWCYGGLLASREPAVDKTEALRRVLELRDLMRAHPDVPVYMSTVILRSSLSTLSQKDLIAYEAMTAYSVHTARFARLGRIEDSEAARAAAARIPPGMLEKALDVRDRNLAVNLAAVDLAAEGALEALSVLQEDTQLDGMPRRDQDAILARIRKLRARGVYLRNGTDEAGALGAAHALFKGRPAIEVAFCCVGDTGFVAPYEDRPFRENIESACAEIGVVAVEDADTVVVVCCPEAGEQAESNAPVSEDYLRRVAKAINAQIAMGRRVYLLDVIRANGGVFPLMKRLDDPNRLWGYSAWNTASNALGTLLAQLATDRLRGEPNRRFLMERLLDDWFYQGHLRYALAERLKALGEDIYRLSDKARAENMLREMFASELPASWPLEALPDYWVSLPWRRVFEIRAEVVGNENG